MSSSPSSFQELNRRRAEKAAQRQQTSNTTSFSDVQAQQTLMNLVDGFRKGEPVTWPPDFATVVFNSVRFFLPKILFFHFLFLFFSFLLFLFLSPHQVYFNGFFLSYIFPVGWLVDVIVPWLRRLRIGRGWEISSRELQRHQEAPEHHPGHLHRLPPATAHGMSLLEKTMNLGEGSESHIFSV